MSDPQSVVCQETINPGTIKRCVNPALWEEIRFMANVERQFPYKEGGGEGRRGGGEERRQVCRETIFGLFV